MKISACPVFMLIAVFSHACPERAAATQPSPEAVGVPATNADAASRMFEAAQLRKDLGTLDRMLSPTYVFVHGSGKVGDRRDFLAAFSNPVEIFTRFDIVNRRVIPIGRDGAIVAAEATVYGTMKGKPFTQHFRYDDTYVSTRGLWEVLYTQVTVLPR